MGLVDDDIFPGNLFEAILLALANFIAGNDDVKVLRQDARVHDLGALFFAATKVHSVEPWDPSRDFTDPIILGGFGNNDEVWAWDIADEFEVSQEGDCLKGFSKTLKRTRM